MAKNMNALSTLDLSRHDWLMERSNGIGGSDCAAIAGVNKYSSPMKVYLEKTNQIESDEIFTVNEHGGFESGSEPAYFGVENEDKVAQEFFKRTGLKVRRRNAILKHPEYDFIYANVDRLIVGKNEGLECKTASEYLEAEWEDDEIPASYLLQCQHYMAVTGYKAWWIAVLIGGNKFIHKRIERDEELITYLINIEKEFWENHVIPNNPPAFDGSVASSELLKAMYPQHEPDSTIELTSDLQVYIDSYKVLESEKKEIELKMTECQNVLKGAIQDNETAFIGEQKITWKSQVSNRIDSTRLKKEQPDIYAQYIKQSISRPFKIK